MGVDVQDRIDIEEEAIQAFIQQTRGPVLRPGDAGYDDARAVWNGMIDRRPALIVQCTGRGRRRRRRQLRARPRPAALDQGRRPQRRRQRRQRRRARDRPLADARRPRRPAGAHGAGQGGATWADVDRETQLFGLATPGGVVSTTGIAGLTLHGGMGHLRRKYGLTIDNLLSVDIVTADGQLRPASARENADLFWAVRGAGSNFGVVTSFEFRLIRSARW